MPLTIASPRQNGEKVTVSLNAVISSPSGSRAIVFCASMDTLLTIIRNVYRIGGRQTQQPTAHQFFRFGIPVSKLAGGLVVNHLIEVGKRDHQQPPANVAAAGFKVMLPRDCWVCS